MTNNIQNGEGVEPSAGDIALAQAITEIEFNNSHATYEHAVASVIAGYRHSLAREPATADVERVIVAARKAADLITSNLDRDLRQWRPTRAHYEGARNDLRSIERSLATLSRAAPSSEPAIAEGERDVTLVECPPGLFLFNDALCFKSGYGRYECDAYVVSTGEYFHGGARNTLTRDNLMVRPILRALAATSTPPASKGVETAEQVLMRHVTSETGITKIQPDHKAIILAAMEDYAAASTPSNDTLQGRGEVEADTVAFVQKWLMNADYDPSQFDRDFAAGIDARVIATTAADLAEQFCITPLPDDVCSDLCATVQGPGRYGTHLLTVDQATRVFTAALQKDNQP